MPRQSNGERLPLGGQSPRAGLDKEGKREQVRCACRRFAWLFDIRVRRLRRADALSSTGNVEDGVGIF